LKKAAQKTFRREVAFCSKLFQACASLFQNPSF